MTFLSVLRFLRPTVIVLVCYAIAMLAASFWVQPEAASQDELAQLGEFASSIESFKSPAPDLGVQEVVKIQLAGLSSEDSATGVLQCRAFASPDNRAATGTAEQFARIVRNEKFRMLTSPERVLVGKPTFENNNARVLVTLVDGKKLKSFVWVLSKQAKAPYADCWMTDGVFPLGAGSFGETPTQSVDDDFI